MSVQAIITVIATAVGALIGAMFNYAIIGGLIGLIVGIELHHTGLDVGEGISDAFDGFGFDSDD